MMMARSLTRVWIEFGRREVGLTSVAQKSPFFGTSTCGAPPTLRARPNQLGAARAWGRVGAGGGSAKRGYSIEIIFLVIYW